MNKNMFCFQCEQTAGGVGCQGCAGVCGKPADVANLQDDITGALISLCAACPDAPSAKRHASSSKLSLRPLRTSTSMQLRCRP